MTFRIQWSSDGTVGFEGFLDPVALGMLRDLASQGMRVVLRPGTEVDPACWDALRSLGLDLRAESPFLARLLAAAPGAPGRKE